MKRLYLVTIFAIAFAYIEAVVVVYLRRILIPTGSMPPFGLMPLDVMASQLAPDILAIERVREVATIVILLSFSILSGRKWEKAAFFLWTFGFWDIFYYIFLYVLIQWPQSLRTIDCLFLIPKPWIAPVYQPVLASIGMIFIGGVILSLTRQKGRKNRS